jgi:type I restriction enzyme S subunit
MSIENNSTIEQSRNTPKGDAQSVPKGWVETSLGEVVSTNDDSINKNFEYSKLEYLDTGSITENKIENFQIHTLAQAPSRAKRLIQDGDIIYSTVRPNQKHYGFIKNPKENTVVSTGFSVIRSKENSYSKFIFYWLTQNSVTDYLHQLAEQSTSAYPSIKSIDIENLSIIIPKSIKEQKAIAQILTAFDDKIELLQAQNKTLETTAQTIFKEWYKNLSQWNSFLTIEFDHIHFLCKSESLEEFHKYNQINIL